MICYNVPFQGVEQPPAKGSAPGGTRSPHWGHRRAAGGPLRAAFVIAASIHALAIGSLLAVMSVVVPKPPPTPQPVEMVFLAPAPAPAQSPANQSATDAAPPSAPTDASTASVPPPRTLPQEEGEQGSKAPVEGPPPAPAPKAEVSLQPLDAEPARRPNPPPSAPRPRHMAAPKPALPHFETPTPTPTQASAPAPSSPAAQPNLAAPPETGQPSASSQAPSPAPITPAWREGLAAWLAQHKSYPEEARKRGTEGTVGVRFTVDRAGSVTDVIVVRGSGSAILDAATVAMLRNALLPPPPAGHATVTVQVHYALAD
jgi:periplasmic protein TonB